MTVTTSTTRPNSVTVHSEYYNVGVKIHIFRDSEIKSKVIHPNFDQTFITLK